MCEAMIEKMDKYRSWVDPSRFSDHHPIYLKFVIGGSRQTRPFKFNNEWLRVVSFKGLICKVWKVVDCLGNLSLMELLIDKLGWLKDEVIGWNKK